jgi:hypothetical protein
VGRGREPVSTHSAGRRTEAFLDLLPVVYVCLGVYACTLWLTREHAEKTQRKELDTVLASSYTVLSQGSLLLLAPSGIEMLFIG